MLTARLYAESMRTPLQLAGLFEAFDADRRGEIGADALLTALEWLGLDTKPEMAAAVLERFDADESGTLNLAEFCTLVHTLDDFAADTDDCDAADTNDCVAVDSTGSTAAGLEHSVAADYDRAYQLEHQAEGEGKLVYPSSTPLLALVGCALHTGFVHTG